MRGGLHVGSTEAVAQPFAGQAVRASIEGFKIFNILKI